MSSAKCTIIFLLYNAEKNVRALLEAARSQRHPLFSNQADWLRVLIMDDASRDATAERVREVLNDFGNPTHFQLEVNRPNLGLSKTLNKAFQMAQTEFVLTCHCDCFFGTEDYVAEMVRLLETNPKVAAITGQPIVKFEGQVSLAERVNLIANLQDVFPVPSEKDLVSVGFAEGRCDGFRIEALKKVGFYDTTLKFAGEDQVLAANLRANGYEVCQAPQLIFRLSVSDEQDTLKKLLKHQQLYGRAHPYILLKVRGTQKGVMGKTAGGNRSIRTWLRVSQLFSVAVYFLAVVAVFCSAWYLALPVLAILLFLKLSIFSRHFEKVPMNLFEKVIFWLFQPFLDVAYTYGLLQGLWLVSRGSTHKPIG